MDHLARVEVRVRTILGENGEAGEAHTVYCPFSHASKLLVDCEVCDRCVELRPDQPFITCAVPDEKPDTLVPIARRFVDRLTEIVRIGDVMTSDVVCVLPSFGLESLRALLLDRRLSAVPVVDVSGFPLGVVSRSDLLKPGRTVGDVMLAVAFTLEETLPLADAIKLMVTEEVQRIPVVDQSGRVVGVLSTLDVMRWLDD